MNKKILLIFMLGMFLFSFTFVSATIKQYDANTREVTIKSSFLGIPTGTIGKARLITPLNYVVAPGYQKVAEFTIEANRDSLDALRDIEFYDRNNDDESINRTFDFKFKTTEIFIINEYEFKVIGRHSNNTEKYGTVIVGNHSENRTVWKTLPSRDLIKDDMFTIGIFTNVEIGDTIEWIPTLFGKRINEWATWTASLNVGLKAYWAFNETSGTTVLDSTFTGNNGLTVNSPVFNTGKIGNALDFLNTSTQFVNFTNNPLFNNDTQSISFWAKPTWESNATTTFYFFDSGGVATGPSQYLMFFAGANPVFNRIQIFAGNTQIIGLNQTHINSFWLEDTFMNFVITMDTSGNNRFYSNGTLINSTTIPWTKSDPDFFRIGASSGLAFFLNGTIDEFGIWNRTLSQQEVTQIYNNGIGITFTTIFPIEITLNSPDNDVTNVEQLTQFNVSVISNSAFDIKNVTIFIDGVENQTNTSQVNGTYFFNVTLPFGSHNWSITAYNDNIEKLDSFVRDININEIIVNSVTFSDSTIEGSSEVFSLNFSKSSIFQVSIVDLIYNGTRHNTIFTTIGEDTISNVTITIPNFPVDSNISFFWSILLDDNSITNTSIFNQSVSILTIDDCSSNTNLIYNYTVFDEADQFFLDNTSIEIALDLFDSLRQVQVLNFSQLYNQTNPALVCLNIPLLATTNYSVDSVVKYSSNDSGNPYSLEYHNILNFTLSNSTANNIIPLFNLLLEDTTEFQLTFRDANLALAPNILVLVQRQYVSENAFKTVEIPITDSNGQTVLHLVKNDIVYNFIMVNSEGTVLATFNQVIAFCQDFTIGDCSLNLNALSPQDKVYNLVEDVGVIFSITFNNATELILLDFLSLDLSTKTVRLIGTRNSAFGNRTVCDESLTSSAGIISCNVSAITDSDRYIFLDIFVDGVLVSLDTIDLLQQGVNFGVEGFLIAFLMILFIITMFMEDKKTLIFSLGIGWVTIISLGLLKGSLFGTASAGVWLLVSILIFMWKLNKEEKV